MINEFDISNLYKTAFGESRGQQFNSTSIAQEVKGDTTPYTNKPSASALEEESEFINIQNILNVRDILGRKIFAPCKIGDIILPNEPTMAISLKKNIIETAMAGSKSKGTVKEHIGVEDYAITIRGLIINDSSTHTYPEDWVKKLHDIFSINASLPILSPILKLIGVEKVVIKEMELPEMIGIEHAQKYSMKVVSDYDFELEIS